MRREENRKPICVLLCNNNIIIIDKEEGSSSSSISPHMRGRVTEAKEDSKDSRCFLSYAIHITPGLCIYTLLRREDIYSL